MNRTLLLRPRCQTQVSYNTRNLAQIASSGVCGRHYVATRGYRLPRRFHDGILIQQSASHLNQNYVIINSSRNCYYHSTNSSLKPDNSFKKAAEPTDVEIAEAEDPVPEWQNPLHHNNPNMNKMFEEDFQREEEIDPSALPPFETDPDKTVAPPHIQDLAHKIVNLTLLELKELTEKIAQHFDFDDQIMAASYSGGAMTSMAVVEPEGEKKAEKVIFDLKLVGFDEKAKIKVIKEIRAIAGLGLKEAKELVESAPKVFQKDLKQDRADELKAQLEAVGAKVEIV